MNAFTLRNETQFKGNELNSQRTKPSQARKQNITSHSPNKKLQLKRNAQPDLPDPKNPNTKNGKLVHMKRKKKKALLRKSEGTCMSGHTIPPWQRRKLG
jgi:hypothetical protein